jgi:DNA primase
MSVCIETYKQVNLVEFLVDHYGLKFKKSGSGYVAGSPFGADKKPSFFVRQLGNRWLFKDFSSGLGGSIIDLVGHLEQLSGVGAILRRLEQLAGGHCTSVAVEEKPSETHRGYDVDHLYHHFHGQDPDVCRRYLMSRGVDTQLVEELISDGEVVHNCYQGKSYCCFAVRDGSGSLQCLDNHEIDGSGKFVLGPKRVYSRDWQELPHASEAFITEGIIDYLSMKTLEEKKIAGIALLGNQLIFDPDLLSSCTRIISALDEDRGGTAAFVDLVNWYPDKEVMQYPLRNYKDPNEMLQSGSRFRRLSPEEKLSLYRTFQRSDNRSELAREWGLDRSHMYAIVRDVEEMVISGLSSRRPGRRPMDQPQTMPDAWQQIDDLKDQNRNLSLERDETICREEFLKLRLKWSEIEAAELRGEPFDEKTGVLKKKQIKKKRKRKR